MGGKSKGRGEIQESIKRLHLKKYLNILIGEIDLAFIALNPTETAIKNGAVFSRNRTFWNILEDAEIIKGSGNIEIINLAKEVFKLGNLSTMRLGFADLLPYVVETDSSKVKPTSADVRILSKKLAEHRTKRVALMGQKVVDAFAKEFSDLPKWKNIRKKDFGFIGKIKVEYQSMEVFAMPFPGTSSIPNRYLAFKKLLEQSPL
jgi:hypothetical protein